MKKIFVLISLMILALSGKAFADADNATSFHGNECDAYFSSQSGQFNHYWNGTHNAGTSGAWISCPIDKDAVSSTAGLETTWVYSTSPSGQQVSCYLVAQGYNATWDEYQPGSGTTGWFSIPRVASDNYWGSNNMYCFLPAGATLNQFVIHER